MHLRLTAEAVKRGVLQAGGLPMEVPVMSAVFIPKNAVVLFRRHKGTAIFYFSNDLTKYLKIKIPVLSVWRTICDCRGTPRGCPNARGMRCMYRWPPFGALVRGTIYDVGFLKFEVRRVFRGANRSMFRNMMGERIVRILRIGADFVSRNAATTRRKVFALRRHGVARNQE